MKKEYNLEEIILKMDNVSLDLNGNLILRDIDLEIKNITRKAAVTGQIYSLISGSGKGKSQLLKLIAGINIPTTGTIRIGKELKPVNVGDVGFVYQNYPLFEHRSVYSNLKMACSKKSHVSEHKDKIDFYLNRFGMYEHRDKYPALLSGGQRQRISIIQQILCSENFILMDEPFSGLDPIMTNAMCDLIEEVASMDEHNTIILVTHDIHSAVSISNIIWMLGHDYETNENGNRTMIPGARIKYTENLMDQGFSWDKDVRRSSRFFDFVNHVRNTFNDL